MTSPLPNTMRRVRLELARDHDHPVGSRSHGYDFIAPLDEKGRIIVEDWKKVRDRCRVRRFWAGEPDEVVAEPLEQPARLPEAREVVLPERRVVRGYRFGEHAFVPGEYVSIKEHDGVLRTFKVMSVLELD